MEQSIINVVPASDREGDDSDSLLSGSDENEVYDDCHGLLGSGRGHGRSRSRLSGSVIDIRDTSVIDVSKKSRLSSNVDGARSGRHNGKSRLSSNVDGRKSGQRKSQLSSNVDGNVTRSKKG